MDCEMTRRQSVSSTWIFALVRAIPLEGGNGRTQKPVAFHSPCISRVFITEHPNHLNSN